MNALPQSPVSDGFVSAHHRRTLVVGLLNNAPDHAFRTTERRFARVLRQAAPDDDIVVQSYGLPEITRDPATLPACLDIEALFAAPPDALVISGAEPSCTDFTREPYWASLTRVIDWARARRMPTILSCLAAHAAVQHLAGIERVRLARKCSGVFTLERRTGHRLLGDYDGPLCAPHSRWNTLPEAALQTAGFRIITSSPIAGVDMFVDPHDDLVLYLNGHPEYESTTLLREYCRDAARFLRGAQFGYPDVPAHAIEPSHLPVIGGIRALADAGRTEAALELVRGLESAAPAPAPWLQMACKLFGNWLDHVRQFAA